MTYYLVQRLRQHDPISERGTGFDRYFSLDYMGSSEFEWGAIPKALAEVRKHRAVMQAYPVTIGGVTRPVYFVGHKGKLLAAAYAMRVWAEGTEHRPPFWGKESTHFKENFAGDPDDYYARTNAWWAIRENVAWALEPDVADKLVAAFNSKPVKR